MGDLYGTTPMGKNVNRNRYKYRHGEDISNENNHESFSQNIIIVITVIIKLPE